MNKKTKTEETYDESRLPDGGWGWLVVFGVAITNMFNQSLISVFGLLFGEYLEEMGHGTAGVALVSNISNMVTCFSGLVTGPVLKTYSCRKVTLCGAIVTSSGLILTSFATTLVEVIVFYSIFASIGLGLMYPATFVAIKEYFTTKQSRAVGLSMAGTGVGQMLMPQIVRILLEEYGYRWTARIIGILCLHGVAGALLFQPVRWHLKKAPVDKLLDNGKLEITIEDSKKSESKLDGVTLQFAEKISTKERDLITNEEDDLKKGKGIKAVCKRFIALLDLKLLNDPVFVNIAFGLAACYTAGVFFGMIFPFFLIDSVHMTKSDTALCMSLLSAMDIVARLTLPSITHFMKISNRTTFLFGALALAIARAVIAEQTDRTAIIVASLICGYIRAATIINQNLTCSDYCSHESLPAALGLVMVARAIFVMSIGQLLGWFRDYTGSYSLTIHATNVLLIMIFVSWGTEMILNKLKKR